MEVTSKDSLRLLNDYFSEDESSNTDDEPKTKITKVGEYERERLPLPESLHSLFTKANKNESEEKPELHEGRKRSFPHQRGNWSTYVYIPYERSTAFLSFCDEMIACCNGSAISLKPITNPHISLTRTIVLLHHWIDSFVESIKKRLTTVPSYDMNLERLEVYCNDEKTRTFLGLAVSAGFKDLLHSVQILDDCLADFRLPPFYKDPSFHLSLVWCLGDQREVLISLLPELSIALQRLTESHPEDLWIHVKHYQCKTGNKLFTFRLAV